MVTLVIHVLRDVKLNQILGIECDKLLKHLWFHKKEFALSRKLMACI